MFKPTVSILAAAMILAPVASAESLKGTERLREVTLHMEYDPAKLTTEEGTASLVKSLKREARRACSQRISVMSSYYVDFDCADTLVKAAIQKIHADQSEAGLDIAPSFQRLAALDYALIN